MKSARLYRFFPVLALLLGVFALPNTSSAFVLEPINVRTSASGNTLSVSWARNSSGDDPTSYDVEYTANLNLSGSGGVRGTNPATQWVDAGHTGTTPSHTIPNLNYDTTYRVRVLAKDSEGNSGWAEGTNARATTGLPPVSLSANPTTVTEGSSVTVAVTLAVAADDQGGVEVPITLTPGTATATADYGTLTSITVPINETTATGVITTNDDEDLEGDETFTVSIGSPLPTGFVAGTQTSAEITILDDDRPRVSLSVSPERVTEGSSVTVTAELSMALASDVNIPITLTGGTAEPDDYGTLTYIAIEAGATTGTGTFTTTQDEDAEPETVTVALGSPLPTEVNAGSANSVEVTILDDNPSALTLSADTTGIPEGGQSVITATLDRPAPDGGTTVTLFADAQGDMPAMEGDDFEFTTKTFTIAAGEYSGRTTLRALVDEEEDDSEIITIDAVSENPVLEIATLRLTIGGGFRSQAPDQTMLLHQTTLSEVTRAVAGQTTGAISARVGQALNGNGSAGGTTSASLGGHATLASALADYGANAADGNGNRLLRDLLDGSDFLLPLSDNGNGDGGDGGGLRSTSLWASGEYRDLSGEEGNLEFDGSVRGAQIGVDTKLRNDLLAGVALSWSAGELEYETSDGLDQGDYEVDVISLHPYIGGHSGRLDWWATLGYGTGEVEYTPEASETSSNDMSLRTVGAGGSGMLWSRDATRVHLKGEFTSTRMEVEESARLDSFAVDTTLARLALAASRTRSLAGGGSLSPSLSLGARHDGGDGNTGTGAEVRGNLHYDNAQSGTSASISAHGLFGRSDYEEWGVQAVVRVSAGADGQGLSFVMRPGYGNGGTNTSMGDDGQIWSHGLREDATPTIRDASGRLEMRMGYGLSASGGRDGLLTPWGGLNLEGDGKRYRVGLDWEVAGPFTLRLHGERRESANSDADHAVLLRGEARF